MCYLVRERQAGAAQPGGAALPPSPGRLRPRWAAAAVAALIGGLAMAALVAPPAKAPLLSATDSAPLAPVVSRAAAVPAAAGVEHGSAPFDDGLPSTSDVVKAGAGPCHHGL